MANLEVLNPVAQVSVRKSSLAARPKTLDNMRIGLYWNNKNGGDVVLNRIGQLMEGRFKGVKVELIRSSHPGPKDKVEYAKTFDAVIGSTGD